MDKQKVLLIENDAFLANIYSKKFEQEGFDVALATNGEDGLKLVQKHQPDAIVLALLMPKMDGFEVLEKLKTDQETKRIPVLICSNLGQKEDVQRCLDLGASRYAIKAHSLPHEVVQQVKDMISHANV